jgi:hypothetical protein
LKLDAGRLDDDRRRRGRSSWPAEGIEGSSEVDVAAIRAQRTDDLSGGARDIPGWFLRRHPV